MLCNSTSTASNLSTQGVHGLPGCCGGAASPSSLHNVSRNMQPHVTLLAKPCARVSMVIMQRRARAGNAEGFSITPFAAGHLLGGCAWRITTPGDEDIVYAVHYNHRKQARAPLGCSHGAHQALHSRKPSSSMTPCNTQYRQC